MTEAEALSLLQASAPYARMRGAQWLALHATGSSRAALSEALKVESVPQVRHHLREALLITTRPKVGPASVVEPSPPSDTETLLANLGELIAHETDPAIGWLLLAAERQIPDLSESETGKAIEALVRRIDGVVGIAMANAPAVPERLSLAEIVESEFPLEGVADSLSLHVDPHLGSDDVDTDPRLLGLILSNALSNSLHAAMRADQTESPLVAVEIGVGSDEFWITVTNRFVGSSFSLDEMGGIGTSTKTGGRGLGLVAMRTAADRLGYQFDVSGRGGIATTSIRGSRFRA